MGRWITRFAVLLAAWALGTVAWAQVVVTPSPPDNDQSILMFDVQAVNALTVTGLSTAMRANGTTSLEIWGRSGSHVGFTNSTAGWTLLGTSPSFTAAFNTQYDIPVLLNVPVAAGGTYAFMIRSTASGIVVGYRNSAGTAGTTVVAADGNLRVIDGTAASDTLLSNFAPRSLVGEVRYTLGIAAVPTMQQWALIVMALLLGALAFRQVRRTA